MSPRARRRKGATARPDKPRHRRMGRGSEWLQRAGGEGVGRGEGADGDTRRPWLAAESTGCNKAFSDHSPHPTPLKRTIYYILLPPSKRFLPYNSFSPIIPLISIPSIYYHSLTNYLFIVFEFKKTIQYLYCHNTHYHHITGLKRD